ncbi:MAG: methyltransferase domain-containing protein, partial [Phycisphaerae bacterium]|nr:methyltransferase domain-containing protein [Phycisphaerae bacterium]NIP54893.1 methyltransferase domain-containing protein [Phycisphaerae bacterium]NIU11176.1 methyltransferase domain-containing protein [Phycisphaerae bacterium]NIX01267.1 methyltransferase domain-containing protein [Phycisphaerae bacterium]NIX30963.1 methyltransferase domain-containing protein [Phycisphaerae bacterium]
YLVGVDLSRAMLEIAKRSRLYDELKQMDLIAFLRANSNAFDILVSADTFVYLGDLRPVFAAAVSAIRKDGV